MLFYNDLNIKIFADGANLSSIATLYRDGLVKGFTTNPSLITKSGIANYEAFAKEVLAIVRDLPVAFQVLADEFAKMEAEAYRIAEWGSNVTVKIPIVNSKGQSAIPLIQKLSSTGISLTVTAVTTEKQVRETVTVLNQDLTNRIAVFAGRIADTGRDPLETIQKAVEIIKSRPNVELIWASAREIFNIFQAESCHCDIITIPYDFFKKFALLGEDLEALSLASVKAFYQDIQAGGLFVGF
jgi:transaldolase